jgi:magnesium chelatase family protein
MSIQRYVRKVSGPLLDRVDIQVAVARERISDAAPSSDFARAQDAIATARLAQAQRYAGTPLITNSDVSHRNISAFCPLEPAADSLLRSAAERYRLSMRSYHKIRKVARTVADLAGSDRIQEQHLAEAIALRVSEHRQPA